MRRWLRRFLRPPDREFAAEVESHLEHETEEHVEAGLTREEARYAALRAFGNVTTCIERYREASPWFWLETLWQDVRYGWRSLRRSRTLFVAAVVSLGLGIGGSTALFSVLYASVIDPLPYPRSDRLVALVQYNRDRAGAPGSAYVTPREFGEYAQLTDVFDRVAGVAASYASVNGPDTPEVQILDITCNFFDVLGVAAQLGRTPHAADCDLTAPPVIVLSHRLWTDRFGADPAVIGQTVRLSGYRGSDPSHSPPRMVIGVMPARVLYWHEDLWIPSRFAREGPGPPVYHLVGRFRDGVDYAQANARVAALSTQLVAAWPADHAAPDRRRYGLELLRDQTVRNYEATMWGLTAGVGCVLILVCVNVATLLFVRATARQKEMAVRISLGANTGRIVRQLVVEGLVLTTCGGLIGVVLASAAMTPLSRLMSTSEVLAPQAAIQLSQPALLATAVSLVLASLVFGMAPALYVLRSDPVRALLSGSRTTGPAGANRWRTVLVTGQIAFAFPVFCTTAALLVSFLALQRAAARYEPDHVLESLITIRGLEHRYDSEGRIEQLFGDIERALQGVPGVSSSASTVPMLLFRIRPSVLQPAGSGSAVRWTVQLRGVSHGFFSTMRIPVLSGRTFLESEQLSRRHVAVVSRSFARTYFRDTHVLGDRAQVTETLSWLRPVGTDPLEIIGVVEDIPLPTGNEDPVGVVPTMYVPRSLASPSAADILVRTALPASAVIPDMRQAIGKVDSDLVVQIDVLQNSIGRLWTAWPRLVVFVAGLFTGVGLVLVLVGIFGVLSYSIGQLTGEIGIRLALGASPARIGRQVLGQGVRWAAIGTALGSVATFALFTIVRSRVWGVGNLDSSLLATAAGVVLLLGAATSWFPARRAMRVDPLTVLRAE